MIKPLIVETDYWRRAGKGKELQFFATDEEIQQWLGYGLPSEYAPYTLMGFISVQGDQQGDVATNETFMCSVSEFVQSLKLETLHYNFWIRSEALTPIIPVYDRGHFEKICSYNALIQLQHDLQIHDQREAARPLCKVASRIAITNQVRNIRSAEIRIHSEYLQIYRTLQRTIVKELVYASTIWDKSGNEYEDARNQLWTEGAVQKYVLGERFVNKPGKPLTIKQ